MQHRVIPGVPVFCVLRSIPLSPCAKQNELARPQTIVRVHVEQVIKGARSKTANPCGLFHTNNVTSFPLRHALARVFWRRSATIGAQEGTHPHTDVATGEEEKKKKKEGCVPCHA